MAMVLNLDLKLKPVLPAAAVVRFAMFKIPLLGDLRRPVPAHAVMVRGE